MLLSELDPRFLKRIDDAHFEELDSMAGADGVEFLCPVCFQKNGGPVGTHSIICWEPRVPQTTSPVPGRWRMSGGRESLTLTGDRSSSVLLSTAPCKAHFFVTAGEIVLCMG